MREIDPGRHDNPLAPSDMLEQLRLMIELDVNEYARTVGISSTKSQAFKNERIIRSFEDCVDYGVGIEAGEMLKGYYTTKK